jgi:hypothetical protein
MGSAISFGDANAGFQAGIVNGPVNTAFHLPLGELQTARARQGIGSEQALTDPASRAT